jgi:predicted MFS family arabinose efflux permease
MASTAHSTATRSSNGVLAPLSEPLFRGLWTAAVISYTGTWMQNVGAGWLMTSLTMSPIMVSLVQVAMSLPVFLVALPAGALADTLDRRRLLLATQWSMLAISAVLGILTIAGAITPTVLLVFTFLLGLGMVMNDPAWQAITPEIVSDGQLAPAVTLNSAAFNIARAVGPALGGLVIAAAGSGSAFLLNAASFLGVIYFLYRWRRPPQPFPDAREHLSRAIRSGFRYLGADHAMRAVLIRTGLFSISASALWAMLPLIARHHGSVGYGAMLSSFGVGALLGASACANLRDRFSADVMVALGTLAFAAGLARLAFGCALWLACLALLFAGIGWIVVVANLNVATQTISPTWVRARALSMYVLVLQGGLAIGSAFWGSIATHIDLSTVLLSAAGSLSLGLVAIAGYPIRTGGTRTEPALPTMGD